MKKLLFLFLMAPAVMFNSCGGETKSDGKDGDSTASTEEVDYTGMHEHDLSSNGLNTKIMVPELLSPTGEKLPVDIAKNEDLLTWEITIGTEYHLIIEEVDGEGNYLQREKDRLKNDGVFVVEYIKEDANKMVYKASLPNEAGPRDYYHAFGVVKINNVEYIVKSFDMGEFSEVQAMDMYKSICSLIAMPA